MGVGTFWPSETDISIGPSHIMVKSTTNMCKDFKQEFFQLIKYVFSTVSNKKKGYYFLVLVPFGTHLPLFKIVSVLRDHCDTGQKSSQ